MVGVHLEQHHVVRDQHGCSRILELLQERMLAFPLAQAQVHLEQHHFSMEENHFRMEEILHKLSLPSFTSISSP
jgi:hypothetical protein